MTIFVVKTRLITSLKLHPVFKTGKQKLSWIKKSLLRISGYGMVFIFCLCTWLKWNGWYFMTFKMKCILNNANFDFLLPIRYQKVEKNQISLMTHIQFISCKVFMLHNERVKHNFYCEKWIKVMTENIYYIQVTMIIKHEGI